MKSIILKIIKTKLYAVILFLIDLILLYLALKFSFMLRFAVFEPFYSDSELWHNNLWNKYFNFFSYFFVIYFLVFHYFHFYSEKTEENIKNQIVDICYANVTYIMIIFLISFYLKFVVISRIYYMIYLIVLIIFNLTRNLIIKKILLKILSEFKFSRRYVVFIGCNKDKFEEIENIFNNTSDYNVLGYFDSQPDIEWNTKKSGCKYLGNLNDFKTYLLNNKYTLLNVIILLDSRKKWEILNLINVCLQNNAEVSVLQDTEFIGSKHISIDEIESIPLIKL
ncbi:hypothetical protein KA977_14560 [Candidatus Dependentiae bacterium]|nr:hypothetical protein [Candidatus Dependentiae bacterium]